MGLTEIPYAPKDITPESYFSDWLPKQFETFKPIVEQFAGDMSAAMSIRVDDKEWTCALSKDGLKIDKGLSDSSLVTIIMNEKDFVGAVTGERSMSMRPPGDNAPSPDKIPGLIKNAMDVLTQINGMLQFRLEDPSEGDFVATIKFAGPLKDEPDTVVSLDRADAEAMGKGELDPQTAFMQGKMRISGDMTLLMQLAPLMMQ